MCLVVVLNTVPFDPRGLICGSCVPGGVLLGGCDSRGFVCEGFIPSGVVGGVSMESCFSPSSFFLCR